MPKCNDCGFLEKETCDNIDPYTKKSVGFPETKGFCTANPKERGKINNPLITRKCKNFMYIRKEWKPTDYHGVKNTLFTVRRSTLLAIATLIISIIITLSVPLGSYYLASFEPKVTLTMEYFPSSIIGSVNKTLSGSFILYNSGTEIGFLEQMHIYKVLDNGDLELIQTDNLAKEYVKPSDNEEVQFSINPPYNGETGFNFRVVIFYGSGKNVLSPVSTVVWSD